MISTRSPPLRSDRKEFWDGKRQWSAALQPLLPHVPVKSAMQSLAGRCDRQRRQRRPTMASRGVASQPHVWKQRRGQ
eukprot:4573578-Pyramimonas_sp.AAC.1